MDNINLLGMGNSIPLMRTTLAIKMKRKSPDPLALECVYCLLMIDLLSDKIDMFQFAEQVQEMEPYRMFPPSVSRIVEQQQVYDMVREIALVRSFPTLGRQTIRLIARAIAVIPDRTLQLILLSKVQSLWPEVEWEEREEEEGDFLKDTVGKLKGGPLFPSIFLLYLFITRRSLYYRAMEEDLFSGAVDMDIALHLPRQLAELERLLVMSPLPTDELDVYVLEQSIKKFRAKVHRSKQSVFQMVELVKMDCWHRVHKYIQSVEDILKKW